MKEVRRGTTSRHRLPLILALIGLPVLLFVAGIVMLYCVATRGPSVPDRVDARAAAWRPAARVRRPTTSSASSSAREVDHPPRSDREPAKGQTRPAYHGGPAAAVDARIAVLGARCRNCATRSPTSGESGKPVIAYLEYGGDREYYLASAANQVFLLPTSPLDLTGIASYEVFLRGALDKIGAYPDFLQIGPYKTAANQITQHGLHARSTARCSNGSIATCTSSSCAGSRRRGRKSVDDVRALLDEGPFTPRRAHRGGTRRRSRVLRSARRPRRGPEVGGRRRPGRRGLVVSARRAPRDVGIRPESRVAVLHAAGIITSGKSAYDPVNGPIVGSDTIVEQIQRSATTNRFGRSSCASTARAVHRSPRMSSGVS